MTKNKVVLVGCGNMGFAMLQGWLSSGCLKPDDVTVVEPAEPLRDRAASLGVPSVASSTEIAAEFSPNLIIIAVKPQIIQHILPDYRAYAGSATFVSVAAGTPVSLFEKLLGKQSAIIRCMPNTPASIGKGMMVLYANANVSADHLTLTDNLLQTSGKIAHVTDENLMDAVTAVSGSGPAYVFHFIECLTDAGVKAGLPRELAAILALQTVYGSAALAADTTGNAAQTPEQLRINVTSPNGTTAAALDVLMKDAGLQNLLNDAVEAARNRSVELGKN